MQAGFFLIFWDAWGLVAFPLRDPLEVQNPLVPGVAGKLLARGGGAGSQRRVVPGQRPPWVLKKSPEFRIFYAEICKYIWMV